MTPLAALLAKEVTLPKRERTVVDKLGLIHRITEAHCFEMTEAREIFEAMQEYRRDGGNDRFLEESEHLMFLPAPMTWVEVAAGKARQGYCLVDQGERIEVVVAVKMDGAPAFTFPVGYAYKAGKQVAVVEQWKQYLPRFVIKHAFDPFDELGAVPVMLAMINTPRILGRRQHMPHAGLQRALARAKGMTGKFPLHAWTEIKLEVRPPAIEEAEPHTAYLTGAKALHFCRAHLRIRRGQLEFVRSHWRGDPSLGIKRSRYSLVPPRLPGGRAAKNTLDTDSRIE